MNHKGDKALIYNTIVFVGLETRNQLLAIKFGYLNVFFILFFEKWTLIYIIENHLQCFPLSCTIKQNV